MSFTSAIFGSESVCIYLFRSVFRISPFLVEVDWFHAEEEHTKRSGLTFSFYGLAGAVGSEPGEDERPGREEPRDGLANVRDVGFR